ncbi:unnamed protein product (macronuclear) [Paramecium tetraurelia]|uniref:Transmembrane protein n=1 Tax=Paramecium tetraurelia TaxID=5888 RepID=A0CDS9_PARTE|nr:uncharacterized protein GSPATT00007158001 [Paramecium tetraurelia]CAK68946.1 unnamed protein product [Paramecium tetraurelia]|eukprot:XP_001436343.1 hypothetical protein (macronuclear) [Paramecium tetraurelia strain d4-2]
MQTLLQTFQQKLSLSFSVVKESTPQILFGISLLSCLYLLNQQQKEEKQIEPEKTEIKQKKKASSQKSLDHNKPQLNDVIQDLKKSQKKLNKKMNKQFDDSIDYTEENIPKSPDYSVISEIDQKYFLEMFQNQKKSKRAYQTDCESSPIISLRGFRRNQQLIGEEDKKGEDRLFYILKQRVIEQEEKENEIDEDDY